LNIYCDTCSLILTRVQKHTVSCYTDASVLLDIHKALVTPKDDFMKLVPVFLV